MGLPEWDLTRLGACPVGAARRSIGPFTTPRSDALNQTYTWESREGCRQSGVETSGHDQPGHALPGDRARWPRDRVVDVKHIRLDVALDVPARTIRGTATHTVQALNDGLKAIPFDAVEMRLGAVTVNGVKAKFGYDGSVIDVALAKPVDRGTELKIAIEYEASPRLGLYFIAPDQGYPAKPSQVWSQGQDEDSRYWFPCYDFEGMKQTAEMVATVPGNWFALSNGKLASDRPNRDGTRTLHWKQAKPLSTYLITLAAGEFSRIDGTRDGLTIDYYVEAKDLEDGRRTFAATPEMIALFERISGQKYPWEKYSQIVVRDFVFGGMENTSATTMTENIIVDAKAALDFTSDDLISHELAHMWWGDLLTCRDWSHGWLNESFATYFELLWDEEKLGLDEYRMGVIVNTDAYIAERYRRPIVTKVMRDPIDIFDRHLYEKGSVVLHMLRGLLRDDQFFRSIRRYARQHAHGSVITQDLIDAITAETGRNLEWFFDQWVYRPGHPKFKVSWSWDDRTSSASVNVKQTQDTGDGTPIFRVPLVIDFTTGRQSPLSFNVEVTEADQTFTFSLPKKPDLCRFDPYNRVLKEIEFEKSVGELRLQLRDDDDIAGRRLAAKGLGDKGGQEAVTALAEAVKADRFWGVGAAAAKALGVVRTTPARDALIANLKHRHPKVRRAVVAALGEFRGDASVLQALRPLAAKDRSWFVEAEAHRSAGKLRLDGSFELLVAGMERMSFRQVVRQACVDGFVELRDERSFEYLQAAAAYGAPHQSRAAATGGMARLAVFFEARQKAVAERLTELLRDPDFRIRMAAANGLKALKDPAHAVALDDMAGRELDGRAVRAAREGAIALRKGAETTSEVKALRDDLEKLRHENVKLRGRLEKLESPPSAARNTRRG
jgi:aminopeptidase N